MFTETLDTFLADFGVPCVFGPYQALVIFDESAIDLLSHRVQSAQFEITYRTDQLPGMIYGSQITVTVNGQDRAFLVQTAGEQHDGVFSLAQLQEA